MIDEQYFGIKNNYISILNTRTLMFVSLNFSRTNLKGHWTVYCSDFSSPRGRCFKLNMKGRSVNYTEET